jgi:hypothetical protein
MTDLDLTEAIKMARYVHSCSAVCMWCSDSTKAVAPLIERQVRERIAAELDQLGDHPGRIESFADGIWWRAAEIARGRGGGP